MIIDYGTRTVGLKIVFFGPAMSGKTTAIRWLFSSLDYADKLTSIENTVGRTMFCDFGTIPFALGNSWKINAHVWSATGQDFYRSTREVVLVGADGVVFMVDSQERLLQENQASWNELVALVAAEGLAVAKLAITTNLARLGSPALKPTRRTSAPDLRRPRANCRKKGPCGP